MSKRYVTISKTRIGLFRSTLGGGESHAHFNLFTSQSLASDICRAKARALSPISKIPIYLRSVFYFLEYQFLQLSRNMSSP